MKSHWNRRRFLKSVAVGAGGVLLLGSSRSAHGYFLNEQLRIAVIGAGGRGAENLKEVASEQIVALCDADERRASAAFGKYPQAKKYQDYRKLLDELEQQIDAVVVSAPNHIHAPASVTAMRRGKHAYCEKPLAHSVYEARVAARVAAEKKVATQMGTQIHASDNFRRVVELIRGGAIGEVRECHCWLAGDSKARERTTEPQSIPPGLNWDVWLGPAPYRPYHSCYVPHDWHFWWDFGGGAFGNMGCHYLDLPFWALGLRHPTSIEAQGSPVHPECTPAWQHVRYEFPAGGNRPAVTLTWTHGSKPPALFREQNIPAWAWGVFVGSKGFLLANYSQWKLWPENRFSDFRPPEPSIPASVGHHQEWISACKTGSPTTCSFDYSGAVTETMLLGNVAYRTGRKIEWDAANLNVTNCPEANSFLRRDYRPGWTL